MTKVRDCTMDDLKFLVSLAINFNNRYYDVMLNTYKVEVYLDILINSPDGVVLRTDTGAITGVFVDDPMRDWRVLVETAWYSEGRDGIRLLDEFRTRGVAAGVDEIRMTTLESNPGVAKLLKRKGYTVIETSHRLLM